MSFTEIEISAEEINEAAMRLKDGEALYLCTLPKGVVITKAPHLLDNGNFVIEYETATECTIDIGQS